MTFDVIKAEKATFPVRTMCRVLGVTPSGFYAWLQRPAVSPRAEVDHRLRTQLRLVHAESRGTYGSPRLLRALRAGGDRIGRHRVMRLMRAEQLRGRPRRRFRLTTQADPHAVPAPNRLNRRFAVAHPNRVWAADITAIPTHEGWLYLAVLLDLCSRRIVGWATRPSLEAELVCAAWHLAVGRRQPLPGLLHHSDRGAQYTSTSYQQLLQKAGARCSMSRPGNCWDNAPVESFFRTLKTELEDQPIYPTRQAATSAIASFIDRFYNTTRLHSALNYQSPLQFEAALSIAV
jgi:putative transposase